MGKPKGKTTAYAFFVRQQKEMFDSENPEGKIVFGDFMKDCGEKWRELGEDEKTPFQEKAAEDAERWSREMENYEPEEETGQKKKRRKKVWSQRNSLVWFFIQILANEESVPWLIGDEFLTDGTTSVQVVYHPCSLFMFQAKKNW